MRLVIAQDKAVGAAMVRLPMENVETQLDDFLHWYMLHAMAVGVAERMTKDGYEGPYVLLLCGEGGEIYGKAPAGLPAMSFADVIGDTSGQPHGYLTGLDQWGEFAKVVKGWLQDDRQSGSSAAAPKADGFEPIQFPEGAMAEMMTLSRQANPALFDDVTAGESLSGSPPRPSDVLALAIASLWRARDYLIETIRDDGLLSLHVRALTEATELQELAVISDLVARAAPLSNQSELAGPVAGLGRAAMLVFNMSASAAAQAARAQETREAKAERLYKKMMKQGPVAGMKVAEGLVDPAPLLELATAGLQLGLAVAPDLAGLAGHAMDESSWETSQLAELGLVVEPQAPPDQEERLQWARLGDVDQRGDDPTEVTPEQIRRIRAFKEVLAEHDHSSVEDALANFRQDGNPEREIRVWERIAKVYAAELADRPFADAEERRLLFHAVLACSFSAKVDDVIATHPQVRTLPDLRRVVQRFSVLV